MVYVSSKDIKDQRVSGDSSLKLVYTFSNRIYKSGVITQARKNRFRAKKESKRKRRERALHRTKMHKQLVEDFKMGKMERDLM